MGGTFKAYFLTDRSVHDNDAKPGLMLSLYNAELGVAVVSCSNIVNGVIYHVTFDSSISPLNANSFSTGEWTPDESFCIDEDVASVTESSDEED